MRSVSITEAKARLSEIIAQVEAGESIQITRRGKPVAVISPVTAKRRPIDIEALRNLTESMPKQDVSAGEFIRRMPDTDRY